MSENDKVPELITKLIYDTNSNRIFWNGGGMGDLEEYHAEYADRYQLFFRVDYSKGTLYHLALSEKDGTRLLNVNGVIDLVDLHEAIQSQTGQSRKLGDAIEHILQS